MTDITVNLNTDHDGDEFPTVTIDGDTITATAWWDDPWGRVDALDLADGRRVHRDGFGSDLWILEPAPLTTATTTGDADHMNPATTQEHTMDLDPYEHRGQHPDECAVCHPPAPSFYLYVDMAADLTDGSDPTYQAPEIAAIVQEASDALRFVDLVHVSYDDQFTRDQLAELLTGDLDGPAARPVDDRVDGNEQDRRDFQCLGEADPINQQGEQS